MSCYQRLWINDSIFFIISRQWNLHYSYLLHSSSLLLLPCLRIFLRISKWKDWTCRNLKTFWRRLVKARRSVSGLALSSQRFARFAKFVTWCRKTSMKKEKVEMQVMKEIEFMKKINSILEYSFSKFIFNFKWKQKI